MLKLAFIVAACLLASPASADCWDESRLAELPGMLASGSLPEKPVTLTPESFIRLQPAVRAALGDHIVICPKNMVKDGSPVYPSRLPLDFRTIWNVLEEAVYMNDWNNVKYVRDHADADGLEPEAVFSLLVIPLLNNAEVEKLRNTINMDTGILARDAHISNAIRPLFLADIYAALGGKAKSSPTIVWSRNIDRLEEARAVAENRELKNHLFLPYSGYAPERARHAMAKFGMNMIEARDFLRQ